MNNDPIYRLEIDHAKSKQLLLGVGRNPCPLFQRLLALSTPNYFGANTPQDKKAKREKAKQAFEKWIQEGGSVSFKTRDCYIYESDMHLKIDEQFHMQRRNQIEQNIWDKKRIAINDKVARRLESIECLGRKRPYEESLEACTSTLTGWIDELHQNNSYKTACKAIMDTVVDDPNRYQQNDWDHALALHFLQKSKFNTIEAVSQAVMEAEMAPDKTIFSQKKIEIYCRDKLKAILRQHYPGITKCHTFVCDSALNRTEQWVPEEAAEFIRSRMETESSEGERVFLPCEVVKKHANESSAVCGRGRGSEESSGKTESETESESSQVLDDLLISLTRTSVSLPDEPITQTNTRVSSELTGTNAEECHVSGEANPKRDQPPSRADGQSVHTMDKKKIRYQLSDQEEISEIQWQAMDRDISTITPDTAMKECALNTKLCQGIKYTFQEE